MLFGTHPKRSTSGASYPVLQTGAFTSGFVLSAGATDSTSNPITFNSPTGGSGSYSYSAALSHVSGSGATLSGSGLGPYTASGLEDMDSIVIILTITDTVTGQVVMDFSGFSVGESEVLDLTAGAEVTSESLASGNTSASVTFNAPSGDSYSTSVTLTQIKGSGASLSGTGLGPYTVSSLEDGDMCLVIAEFTGGEGDIVKQVYAVTVEYPTDLTVSQTASPTLTAGDTSTSITFNTPTGDSYSTVVALTHVIGSGASVAIDTGLTYDVTGLEDGDVVEVTATHTGTAGDVVVDTVTVAVPVTAVVTDIIDFGTVDYDFLTTGGTSGSGGEGAHTVNGISITLNYRGGPAPTQLEFISGVLTWDCNTAAAEFVLVCDAGSSMQGKILSAYSKMEVSAMDGSTSAFILSVKENNAIATNVAGNLECIIGLSGTATTSRFRGVVSGSTFDNFDTTITDITTTSVRNHIFVHHNGGVGSVDNDTSDLPDYGALGTVQTQTWNQGNRKQTFSDYRYLHIRGAKSDGEGVFKLVDIPAYS